MFKKWIEVGERIKVENAAQAERIHGEYDRHSYDFPTELPSWLQWLDKKLPKPSKDWR